MHHNVRTSIRRLSSVSAAVGAVLVAFAAATVLEGWMAQKAGQHALSHSSAMKGASDRAPSLSKPKPRRGDPIATLEVPRLSVSLVVLEGSDDGVLKRGPGHVEDTAFPGELGNVAIAGHRDTHFRPFRNIRTGDEVLLKARDTVIRYLVESTEIIEPTEMEILDPTPGPTLTLVTCYPFDFVGSAPMRFIIRATRSPEAPLSQVQTKRRDPI